MVLRWQTIPLSSLVRQPERFLVDVLLFPALALQLLKGYPLVGLVLSAQLHVTLDPAADEVDAEHLML